MKKVTIEPVGESALVNTGARLLTALLAKDLRVLMSCGGKGICSTCHVRVCAGMEQLSPVGPNERRTLALVADAGPDSRLACQAIVYGDGVEVRVPEGMYIEKADDLLSLLGTRAPENILHPITGVILIPKGKLITRTLLEQSRRVDLDMKKMREGYNFKEDTSTGDTASRPVFTASGVANRVSPGNTTQFYTRTTFEPRHPPVSPPANPPAAPASAPAFAPAPASASAPAPVSAVPPTSAPALSSAPASSSAPAPAPPPVARSSPLPPPSTPTPAPPVGVPLPRPEFKRPPSDPSIAITAATRIVPSEAAPAAPHVPAAPRGPLNMRPPEIQPGTQFGKYLLLECVGKGGSGIVYRALHTTLKTLVAVKFLRPELGSSDGTARERLAREAQLLAQLSHPNVVRVLDYEDDPVRPYVVMEFVEGLSAADLIRQSGRLAWDRAVEVTMDVARGLEAARKIGIIHRDVKPGNILVTRSGASKLVDLGLATVSRPELAVNSLSLGSLSVEGTVGYMSPEALTGGHADHRSDIYSLGATLFHLIAGRLPFTGRSPAEVSMRHLQQPPPVLHEVIPEAPPRLSAVIQTMMAKNPAERYKEYAELLRDLAALGPVEVSRTA